MSMSLPKKSVCIIGAGAAGLCALRHFAGDFLHFEPVVCYEQTESLGGTWNYVEQTESAVSPFLHSSMYRDLRTNLPMQIMEFPDFSAVKTAGESYLHHSKVLEYLHDYADHFRLRPFISFSHQLIKVARNQTDNCWEVTVCQKLLDKKTSKDDDYQPTFTRHFDILLLCSGRYSRPKWPANLETLFLFNFTGSVIHSHNYRSREAYAGQTVAVIGGGPSGLDISLELSTVAREVIFIHRNSTERVYQRLPENVRQISGGEVGRFTTNSVEVFFSSGTKESFPIDAVIFATGYRLSLDFLDQPSCGLCLHSESDSINGLYRHLVNSTYPSMAILAVAVGAVLPFPLYHQQVRYFRALQLGAFELSSKEEITAGERVKQPTAKHNRNRHLLKDADSLREYIRSLEKETNLDRPLKPVLLRLFSDLLHRIQLENSATYKEQTVVLLNDEQYELY